MRDDSNEIKNNIKFDAEKVSIRTILRNRIRKRNIFGDWVLIEIENLAIIIKVEIHSVNKISGDLKESKDIK